MLAILTRQYFLCLLFLAQVIRPLPNGQSVLETRQMVAFRADNVTENILVEQMPAPFGRFIEKINGVDLELVRMPTGTFFMGNDLSPNPEEKPAHSVNVKSFYIGKYEITRQQWNIVVDTLPPANHPLERQPIGAGYEANTPADVISWDEAIEFCERLTRFTGRRYRLPSEAEWEYACRAGTRTEYSFGDQFNPNFANLEFVADSILPIGKLGYANAWGLYDMHGNVTEWCLDNGHPNYIGAPTDGSAWLQGGNETQRINRGGRYRWKPELGRSSSRWVALRSVRTNGEGVRLAAEINLVTGDGKVSTTSAASYQANNLATDTIASLFGDNLAAKVEITASIPLPIGLAGASVFIRDSRGNEFASPLFFVSPNQINLQIPYGLALGPATVYAVNNGNIHSSGSIEITKVSPGLFSADASGKGLAAATILRVKANGQQVYEPVGQFDSATGRFVPVPIEVGNPAEQVFVLAFGTGFRNHSGLANVSASVGGSAAEVLFAGKQGDFVGLDQSNVRLSPSLAGRGDVNLALTVDGKTSNTVTLRIK